MEQLLSVAEEMNGNRTGTITDIGTDNSEHMEMIASEVKAGKDPIVNFNQDSKVIVKHKESPDTRNNLTKLCVDDLLSTTVSLKTRNKPERLFAVNVISSDDPLLTTLTQCRKADKQGVCEDSKVPEKENKALVEERIGQIKRELFVGGMIGLAERVGKG